MATRVKVTYIAIDVDGHKPIASAGTFEDLKLALDEYYSIGKDETARCLGFTPYESKYGDEYEGYYEYEFKFSHNMVRDTIKVYCIDFYPYTIYEI